MHKKDMYYHVNKFISVVRSKCVNNTTIAPKAKNGPNGTICVFFKLTAINDIGNPINAPTTIDINALGIPNIKPKMANSFISLSSLDLVDLMYYKGKIINLGVDNFEKDPSTNILAVRNNSLKKLKKMIYNMYELTTLKPEVLMALKKDVNNYCTVEKMLLNFKENIKKSYGKTISTLSDIKVGDMIGNSYSWANKHW